jgi:hypothetical protein
LLPAACVVGAPLLLLRRASVPAAAAGMTRARGTHPPGPCSSAHAVR